MLMHRLLSGVVCAVLLSACATATPPAPARPAPTLAAVLTDAETAQKAGQNGRAVMLLREATDTWPAEKMPWLRMAQLRFETNHYGEAILSAQEALERDPEDTVANSLIAVSSLRLASRALADLSHRNNINGSIKSEAQDLAKLLREALHTKDITQSQRPPPKNTREPKTGAAPAPAPKAATPDGTFSLVR
jgi:predicted Zn-dependent protease